MIRVDLPYPNKLLWPNGPRGNHFAVSKQKKSHRAWAHNASMAAPGWQSFASASGPFQVNIIVSRKASGVYPDQDNVVAAAKAYLDGIADRLGVNDRLFAAPTVEFAPHITGRFVIEIGAPAA